MPLALWALMLSAFAIGTTEFVIVGLIPTIASSLAVSVPSAGLLVSLYALGVAIGAPVLTALTGRIARKPLLLGLMVVFTLGNLIAWLAPSYELLMAARVLTGLAHGVFFSIGSTIAASLVPREKAASAIALMFSGLTVALVTGVPLGTFIGQAFGWQTTFLQQPCGAVVNSVERTEKAQVTSSLCHYRAWLWRYFYCLHLSCAYLAGGCWVLGQQRWFGHVGVRRIGRLRQYLGR